MNTRANPHEEPGLSPLEFARLQDELQKSNAELAAVNAALRESEQQLEQRVAVRTQELSTLLRVTHNITTTLELEPLLGLIIDQLREVVEYRLASISILARRLRRENDKSALVIEFNGFSSVSVDEIQKTIESALANDILSQEKAKWLLQGLEQGFMTDGQFVQLPIVPYASQGN